VAVTVVDVEGSTGKQIRVSTFSEDCTKNLIIALGQLLRRYNSMVFQKENDTEKRVFKAKPGAKGPSPGTD
jgi:hypothetical protein